MLFIKFIFKNEIKELESGQRQNFWNILEKGFEKNSIMGCCIFPDPNVKEVQIFYFKILKYSVNKLDNTKNILKRLGCQMD